MPIVVNGYAGARNATGLLVTAVAHVALGAALLTLGVVELPRADPEPIITRNIPEPPKAVERIEPRVVADPIDVPIYAPPVEIFVPLRTAPDLATTGVKPVDMPPVDAGPSIAPPPPAEPVFVGARLDPRYAARFQPPYPAASQRLEEEGTVLVRVRVGVDGRVLAAEVVRSSGHPRLDEAAVRHAQRAWRFVPATRDGLGVEGWKEIPVRFELNNG